jgi:hypothetical protein
MGARCLSIRKKVLEATAERIAIMERFTAELKGILRGEENLTADEH